MFFFLSKTLGFFASPSNLAIAFGLLGIVLLATRFARAGRRLTIASLIVLAIAGLSPAGNALMIPLEERFPPWDATRGAPDGIVVLGGGISPDVSAARNEVALTDAAERITAAVALARRYPDARIIYSGGSGAMIYREGSEAEPAVRIFESLGIPHARIVAEEQSRNTIENAVFSKLLAMPKPGGCWSPRAIICPAPWAFFARRAFRSKPIRLIGARAGAPTCCVRSRPWGTDWSEPTPPFASGSGYWSIG